MLINDLLNIMFDQSDCETQVMLMSMHKSKTAYAKKYSSLSHFASKKNKIERKNTEEFRETVRRYVKLDDMVRNKQLGVRKLEKCKKSCEDFIIKYMKNMNLDGIDIGGERLMMGKVECNENVNNDSIKGILTDKLKDQELVEEIINSIDESRQIGKKVSIKRISTITRPTNIFL